MTGGGAEMSEIVFIGGIVAETKIEEEWIDDTGRGITRTGKTGSHPEWSWSAVGETLSCHWFRGHGTE